MAQAGNEEDRDILSVLDSLSAFYRIIEREPYHMSAQSVQDVQTHLDTVLYFYRKLGLSALAAHPPERRWMEVPKFHFAQHIGLQAKWGNPRWSWTYTDEDFMGHLKRICQSASVGTASIKVVYKLMQKWFLGVSLRLLP